VDLPNAVPGREDKAEAVVNAWLPQADVVVIPIDSSVASFEGAADMLTAIAEMRFASGGSYNPGLVVAYLNPLESNIRKAAPALASTLEQIEELGANVVDIPVSSRLAVAEWSDQPKPLTQADPRLTKAYWQLLARVVSAARERDR
jgi:cellulose biosynthesis protein BcsQ